MYKLFVDGASRGNPGPASIGASLCHDGKEVKTVSVTIGEATNNEAEYMALILGLQCVIETKIDEITVCADSQLMVRQMTGEYRVKDEKLKRLHKKAKSLADAFVRFSIHHIPREQNKRADQLANQALDA